MAEITLPIGTIASLKKESKVHFDTTPEYYKRQSESNKILAEVRKENQLNEMLSMEDAKSIPLNA